MTTHVKARCLKYICQRPPIQACLSWVRTWSTCCRIIFVIILLRFQMSSGSSKMSVLHFVTYHQHATLQMPRQRWCVTRRLRAKPKRKPTIPAVLHAVPLLLPPSLSLSLSLSLSSKPSNNNRCIASLARYVTIVVVIVIVVVVVVAPFGGSPVVCGCLPLSVIPSCLLSF